MNLREFLSDPAICLPRRRGTDDFQGFIGTMLDSYREKLIQLTEPSWLVEIVQRQLDNIGQFCCAAKEVVRATLAGHPHEAYSQFLAGIDPFMSFVERQALKELKTTDLGILYRVRKQLGDTLTREGLFHIPFESRHQVGTQRYSIPGLPCLYLGGSVYTCWAEMGRPPFHELHTSAFWLTEGNTVSILNLSDRPARLLQLLTQSGELTPRKTKEENPIDDAPLRELLITHVILWPLLALCSIEVRHRNAPFKPEYILPQILLQWVTEKHKFDGICYFSMHVESTTNYSLPPSNLVFPAIEVKPQGRCAKLRKLFKMTEPHPWELLRAVNAGGGGGFDTRLMFDFEFINGQKETYYKTEFGNVQYKLNKLAYEIIKRNANGEPDLGTVAE